MLRKLEFDTIYYTYLNISPFKYYISILGGVGVRNSGKPAYIILARSLRGEGRATKSIVYFHKGKHMIMRYFSVHEQHNGSI